MIGKGGSVIRALTEETGTTIEIEDDGTVKIAATDGEKAKFAIRRIEGSRQRSKWAVSTRVK